MVLLYAAEGRISLLPNDVMCVVAACATDGDRVRGVGEPASGAQREVVPAGRVLQPPRRCHRAPGAHPPQEPALRPQGHRGLGDPAGQARS